MRTDREQSDENREEAGLEEALKLWVEIRQLFYASGSAGCFGFNLCESLKPSY